MFRLRALDSESARKGRDDTPNKGYFVARAPANASPASTLRASTASIMSPDLIPRAAS
ncbi:hypothetical protein D9M68_781760 [compost metagenome]